MKTSNQNRGSFSLKIFLLGSLRVTCSCLFLDEITKGGFCICCLYRLMFMNQGQLQDLPSFLKAISALVATASINAGVRGKGWVKVAH